MVCESCSKLLFPYAKVIVIMCLVYCGGCLFLVFPVIRNHTILCVCIYFTFVKKKWFVSLSRQYQVAHNSNFSLYSCANFHHLFWKNVIQGCVFLSIYSPIFYFLFFYFFLNKSVPILFPINTSYSDKKPFAMQSVQYIFSLCHLWNFHIHK